MRARRILEEAAEARNEIAEHRDHLAGPLRISAPVSFGSLHLGRALYPFLLAHPGIQLNLELDDRFVDVAAGGYDAVIRHGNLGDARVVARKIATSKRHLVASPAYLQSDTARRARRPSSRRTWRSSTPTATPTGGSRRPSEVVVVRPSRFLRVNNGLVMRDAALAGVGIALLPTFLVGPELAQGTLQVVDVGAATEGADIFVAYPAARRASAKVRALVAALTHAFDGEVAWRTTSTRAPT